MITTIMIIIIIIIIIKIIVVIFIIAVLFQWYFISLLIFVIASGFELQDLLKISLNEPVSNLIVLYILWTKIWTKNINFSGEVPQQYFYSQLRHLEFSCLYRVFWFRILFKVYSVAVTCPQIWSVFSLCRFVINIRYERVIQTPTADNLQDNQFNKCR